MQFKADITSRIQGQWTGYDTWYSVLTVYSATVLTKKNEDHLVAIAGVAKEISKFISLGSQNASAPRYMSGLWLEDIHRGLLWRGLIKNLKRCDCSAPSWSWAACQSMVIWPMRGDHIRPRLKILEPCVEPERNGETVQDGSTVEELMNSVFKDVSTKLIVRGVFQPVSVRTAVINTNDDQQDEREGSRSNVPSDLTGLSILTDTDIPGIQNPSSSRLKLAATPNHSLQREEPREEYHLLGAAELPDKAGGWTVMDRMPETPPDIYWVAGVFALAVRSRLASRGQSIFSFLKMGKKVYDVLLIASVGSEQSQRYMRVGVGCVINPDMVQGFDKGGEATIELV